MRTLNRVLSLLTLALMATVWGADVKKTKVLDPFTVLDSNSVKAGYSKISIINTGEWEHGKVLNVEIDFAKSDFGGVNKTLDPNQLNPNRYKGLRFFAKSTTASQIQVTLAAKDKGGQHLIYKAMAPVNKNWSEIILPFSSFEGPGGSVPDSVLSHAISLFFSVHKRDNGDNPEANLFMDSLCVIEK